MRHAASLIEEVSQQERRPSKICRARFAAAALRTAIAAIVTLSATSVFIFATPWCGERDSAPAIPLHYAQTVPVRACAYASPHAATISIHATASGRRQPSAARH